jgi:hypothetical protein
MINNLELIRNSKKIITGPCHIEGSMITAIWPHLQMFQNSKFYQFMINVEFCLSRFYGDWTVTCTYQYRPWKGSIKPSLQQFQFCCVGLSLGILFLYILSIHQRCLFRVEAVKSRPVNSIRGVIFPILKDRSARHSCCACVILVLPIRHLSCWVVPVFLTWILLNHP